LQVLSRPVLLIHDQLVPRCSIRRLMLRHCYIYTSANAMLVPAASSHHNVAILLTTEHKVQTRLKKISKDLNKFLPTYIFSGSGCAPFLRAGEQLHVRRNMVFVYAGATPKFLDSYQMSDYEA
jgi:hypothetical protein